MNTEKKVYTLKIDKGFKELIRPLFKNEYLQLEANLIADGCREPIAVWNGVIVDGHNRYKICSEHGIPFSIEEMTFSCREEAVAWICANQLGRRNLTEESRKFLIGKQYESEKVVTRKRAVIEACQNTNLFGKHICFSVRYSNTLTDTGRTEFFSFQNNINDFICFFDFLSIF